VFDPSSRYAPLPRLRYDDGDGREIAYVGRRILPIPSASPASVVTVGPGERLDNVANRVLGVPTLFWRLADQNPTLHPLELASPGAKLEVPSPFAGGAT
jgi:hypothetical protein